MGPTKPKKIVAAGSFISEPSLELLVSAWVIYPRHGSEFSFHGYPYYILYLLASSGYPPLLKRYGPLPTEQMHPKIEVIHPDLCDNNIDRVIDGKHFGKKWKHAIRTAQQHLKKTGEIELVNRRWQFCA